MQRKQDEWAWQWGKMEDACEWLFHEWIAPLTMDVFRDKDVLDCGCGGGQHLAFVSPYARSMVGVDLNATEAARLRTHHLSNVTVVEDDIATMDLQRQFDVVYSIGVLHHTDDPQKSFQNIARHCKPGGTVIIWVYSREGNTLNRAVLEPIKWLFLRHLPRRAVLNLAHVLTLLLSAPIYTIYTLPLSFLPFYEYFANWRRLSYSRNVLNVFDKLNAPQTWFLSRSQIASWFKAEAFESVKIVPYRGVSWHGSGRKH